MKMKPACILFIVPLLANLVTAAPETLVQSVSYEGETITMRLAKEELRGDHFELRVQNATGDYDTDVAFVAERSYLGSVDEYPDAVSCGILQDDGQFCGAIYFDRGVTWFTLGASVVKTRALDYRDFSNYHLPQALVVGAGQMGASMYGFDLGIDVDSQYFAIVGSVANALERIEYSVCLIRAIYMRDLLLRPYLGRVVVRADAGQDPYAGSSGEDYLMGVMFEWNQNHDDAERDVVAGISSSRTGGGLAYIGHVGTWQAYSVNDCTAEGNFDVILRHEMGHNWDGEHFEGGSPEGKGIMGGNSPARFSGCEVRKILDYRTARLVEPGVLDDEGTYTEIELPPYACMESGVFTHEVTSNLSFDVLANDFDANGQALSLHSFDAVSAHGGAVELQGQELAYSPNGAFTGTDHFTYKVADTAGRTATGVVVIDVIKSEELRLFLPLDESAGTTVIDRSPFANPAVLSGANLQSISAPGQYGNAIDCDGVDDHVEVSGEPFTANTVTMTAWVNPAEAQNDRAGIVLDSADGACGLNISSTGEIGYYWRVTLFDRKSGITIPSDTWSFVALVVEPDRARIHVDSGSGFQSYTKESTHFAADFGTTHIGRDPNGSTRYFNGMIDDVRIYESPLSLTELEVVRAGGIPEAPSPFDGATGVRSPSLGWAPCSAATNYNIYLGTNKAAVASATVGSAEHVGSASVPTFNATLSEHAAYYWRVDAETPTGTILGAVWGFSTGDIREMGTSIAVNFQRNSGESFNGGALIGPLETDGSHWNEGSGASGGLTGLIDNNGLSTPINMSWNSKTVWSNNDGTADDERRLATGYLADGDMGGGKGVSVVLNNIPYAHYRIYGLFSTDLNGSGAWGMVNYNINGSWAHGGSASTVALGWGSIGANHAANGEYWTEAGTSARGNYWVAEASGPTCTIVGEDRQSNASGNLSALIIEQLEDADGDGTPDIRDEDDDDDGIPDAWETGHGLDPLVANGDEDPDGDQQSNWYEYMFDTLPLDRTSEQTLSIEIDPGTGDPVLRFPTSPNRYYVIEACDALAEGGWEVLSPRIQGTGRETSRPVPPVFSKRFFRIRGELP